MRWPDDVLRSPLTGLPLRHDRPHSLSDGARRWPVVDRIPLLLADRLDWLAELLALLDRGEDRRARLHLLQDAPGADRDAALVEPMLGGGPSLRDTLDRLAVDPDARHAHAWLLPDHLAGLALVASRHVGGPVAVVGAGAGALVRDLAHAGLEVVGVDRDPVLLWIARRFSAPSARLVAATTGPDDLLVLPSRTFGTAVLTPRAARQPRARLPELARIAAAWVAVGVHPRDAADCDGVAAAPVESLADDLVAGRPPTTGPVRPWARPRPGAPPLGDAAAVSPLGIAATPGGGALRLDLPPRGAVVRRNPLLLPLPGGARDEWAAAWPTPARPPGADWTLERLTPVRLPREHRESGRVGEDGVDELARRRVLVDLPARW